MKYQIVRFYRRNYLQEFATQREAELAIQAHALRPKSGNCYTELWAMANDNDGEMVAVYDYGTNPPNKLIPV